MAGFGNQGCIPCKIIDPPGRCVLFVYQLKRSAACNGGGKSKRLTCSSLNQFAGSTFNRYKGPQLFRISDIRLCQSYCAAVYRRQSLSAVQDSNMEAFFCKCQLPAVNGFVAVIPP